MGGYFFDPWDPKTNWRRREPTMLRFDDFFEAGQVHVQLEDAVEYGDVLGARVPTAAEVAALPVFDIELWVYFGSNPDFITEPYSEEDGYPSSIHCLPEALDRYARALRSLADCVPEKSQKTWNKLIEIFERLAASGLGLQIAGDDN